MALRSAVTLSTDAMVRSFSATYLNDRMITTIAPIISTNRETPIKTLIAASRPTNKTNRMPASKMTIQRLWVLSICASRPLQLRRLLRVRNER
jgi:hypothetical protein